jgi:transcriptional regulator of acetoin/glycerol metabolism
VNHLLAFIAGSRKVPTLTPEALTILKAYRWPGNLRELHNVLERAFILSDGKVLEAHHFAGLTAHFAHHAEGPDEEPQALDLKSAEKAHIAKILRLAGGNVPEAARILGVSKATLYRKMAQHRLRAEGGR